MNWMQEILFHIETFFKRGDCDKWGRVHRLRWNKDSVEDGVVYHNSECSICNRTFKTRH